MPLRPFGPFAGGLAPGARPFVRVPPREDRRPLWLVLAAAPMLLRGFGDGPLVLARVLLGFGAIAFASALTREGLRAAQAAATPALPRKLLGGLLFGAGLGLAATGPEAGFGAAVLTAVIGAALHLAAFGPEPVRDWLGRRPAGAGPETRLGESRAARATAAAESQLSAIVAAIESTADRELIARAARFAGSARSLFRAVEATPQDLPTARRHLGIYLEGARAASERYAALSRERRDPQARARYLALLDDLEADYTARAAQRPAADRRALDLEIDVLRERLAREGLAPAPDA